MSISRRAALALAAAALPRAALAQAPWPERPLRIIVPYTPGAFNDILARIVGERMQEAVGAIGVVENRPGAGGSLGIAATAQATDGHTIAVCNAANIAFNPFLYANLGYDTLRDLAPLCTAARLMNCVAVPADGPRSLAELLERARARPGEISYASSGTGSSPHLAAELITRHAGVQVVHVPYRGSAPAVADLLAGRVQFTVDNLPNVLPNVQAGRLRALAVTGAERDPALPEVPTLAEAGLPDTVIYVWFGFVGPATMPQPVRDKLAAAITGVVAQPDTAERIRRGGAQPWPQDQPTFAALIRRELDTWGGVIRAANLRME